MKFFPIALSLASLLVTVSAFAGGASENGIYAGLNVGDGKPDIKAIAPNTISKKSNTVVGGILGYKVNKNFAVEGEYTGIGKVKASNGGTAKGDAASLSAVGILPVGDKFQLFGKAGYANTKTKLTNFGATKASRSAPTYGLGAQYNINPMLGIRVGWDRYGAAINDAGSKVNSNANVTSIGAVFNF